MKQKVIVTVIIAAIVGAAYFAVNSAPHKAENNPQICTFAAEHSVSLSEYPNELVELLERNPETQDFVLNYPLAKDAEYDTDVLLPEDGSVPLFLQWDKRWGYMRYSGELMGISGCGPTVLSMAASYLLNNEKLSPAYIADFSEKNGFASRGNGTAWRLMSEGAQMLGLTSEEVPLWENSMVSALTDHKLIICAMGKGDFTSTGHFILLTDYEDGLFSVRDPNSVIRSERLWSYDEISGQIRGMWAVGAP
ncbi:MAG: C39 family peptidase [Oscillospiraceae bacterium]